ncbi:phosphatidylglycerol lysyltransferase domain-containing protein, partial [Planctomycetota bacterium]
MTIAQYPDSSEVSIDMRPALHPKFQALADGISEFTFANIYLFRRAHNYRISRVENGLYVIIGQDNENPFFMLPFGLPDENIIRELFNNYHSMKAATEQQAETMAKLGYSVCEDRDNFDYLYSLENLVNLTGRKFHKKKNMLNIFIRNNECQAKPLLEEYRDDALQILEQWNDQHGGQNDF